MRLIILCLLLFSFAFSKPVINITSDNSSITNFKLSYYIDETKQLEFKDINSIKFTEGKNKDSLGAGVTEAWIKIQLYNATSKNQTRFLHQSVAYTSAHIEYFELDSNHHLINKLVIMPNDPQKRENLIGSEAVYPFTLGPNESKTIYVHQSTNAYHFYNFSILNKKESIQHLIFDKVDSVLMIGLSIALILYNFLIFLSSRYREYLYYTLYLTSSTLWTFYMYGSMSHYFHIYGEIAYKFNFALMITPIFLALFLKSLLNTKAKYKKENIFLNSIIIVFLANLIFALIDFSQSLQILSITLNYGTFIFLGVAISIYAKGNQITKIFLFAHVFYVILNIYSILFYIGHVDYTYISFHGIGIGIGIEAFLLSYLVSYKFKIMKQEKEESNLLATTDFMTKLYNRRYFMEVSQNLIQLYKRNKNDISLIMIDIDNFKSVNDTYGHQFGDEVIILLSDTMIMAQRESDIVCRYGGEEFVILLPNSSLKNATTIAQNIRKSIELSTIELPSKETFKFTISIGVSQVSINDEDTIEVALKRADDALYEAKSKGKNQVCIKEKVV